MAREKKKHKIDFLMILAILFLVAGVVLLLIEPYRNWKRNKKVEEIINVVESQLLIQDEGIEVTYVVNVNDYKVNGEDTDVYYDDILLDDEDIEGLTDEEIAIRESIQQSLFEEELYILV